MTTRTIHHFNKVVFNPKYLAIVITILFIVLGAWLISIDAKNRYETLLSPTVFDRNNTPLSIKENSKGHYVLATKELPDNLKELLIKKEDRFFYYHLGVNPVSTIRALFNYITNGKAGGSSTITQQLAKNLLATESERSVINKIIESAYAFGIEVFFTKDEVLLMYANTVYLGNQIQGFETASRAYFEKPLTETTHSEKISLLATLSYPSTRNPWGKENVEFSKGLNNMVSPDDIFAPPTATDRYSFQSDSYFELRTAGVQCATSCVTTIDDKITAVIRDILDRHISSGWSRNIKNGAVVVIDAKNLELITMIGSRNPDSDLNGNQINMAIEPRPIGSTVKPFIYAKGFMEGLRPYSLVEDREYKYPIATGFSLYPKNYDGQYRGEVTLHEALSNSLNVPTVKVLEYIGLDNFYTFLSDSLKFKPIQDYDSYQYGIALGGLEMDLLTLTHYFTVLPQKGFLSPLKVLKNSDNNFDLPPQSDVSSKNVVIPEEYVELVHAIISDRFTGVNQFGLKGNLNLTIKDYGVKTGTSRDFHDSWVVGYTGDFVVGVWLGNSENQPLEQVSGSSGAGAAWHDVMEYLLTTNYNQSTGFTFENLERFNINNSDEWGIKGDMVAEHRNILQENNLILSIHEGDTFEMTKDITIPLKARRPVIWSVNGEELDKSSETSFSPDSIGRYEISAYDEETSTREILLVRVILQE